MFTVMEFDQFADRVRNGEKIVVVEASVEYPGELSFEVIDQVTFVGTYRDFMSRLSLLSERFLLDAFVELLGNDGWEVIFLPSCEPILAEHRRHQEPLEIDGFDLPTGLFGFQQYALRRAFEASETKRRQSGFFFNWSPGAGKGTAAAAGIQELLVNRRSVDIVIFFTLRRMKINMARRVEAHTQCKAEVVDGTPARRKKRYEAGEAQVYVMNYEKTHVDQELLANLIRGKRVLFILDEVQKVLFDENGKPTLARWGFETLVKKECKKAVVWPMSATVVKASPVRFHDVFRLQEMKQGNPLGSKEAFIHNYSTAVNEIDGFAGRKKLQIDWDEAKLAEVPHRVAALTQPIRKTSPGIRELFQDMTTLLLSVQLSPEDRRLYDLILADAKRDRLNGGRNTAQYYMLGRHVCNTPESLRHSESPLAQHYVDLYPELITSKNSAKLELMGEKLEEIIESGDKCVVFCSRTNMGLFLIGKELERRKIRHVLHYGVGMTDSQAQEAQDRFMDDPSISVFLSSDAGASGLNLQAARYVLNYDCPYDPDLLTQRNDRIDRADSHLSGLTAFVMVTEDTFEQRIWDTQDERRRLSGIVQGTTENLSRLDAESYALLQESEAHEAMLFGRQNMLTPR